jgi:uncharacterized protein YukE
LWWVQGRAVLAEEKAHNQEATVQELQDKLQRLKRDWKGASVAASNEKAKVIESETELFKVNQRAEKAEKTLRDVSDYHV